MRVFAWALFPLSLFAFGAAAEAKIASENSAGFLVTQDVAVPGTPAQAYAAFVKIDSWWNGDHTFSGNAENLSLDTRQGGCWCETIPDGGFVRHMDVIRVMPGQVLVFSGGRGPLQTMGVAATFAVEFHESGNKTNVTWQYAVGGYDPGGFTDLPARVDKVLAEQIGRFRKVAAGESL